MQTTITERDNPGVSHDTSTERFFVRVLSGIQSSGKLHLGNYLGAMKQEKSIPLGPDHSTLILLAGASLGRRPASLILAAYVQEHLQPRRETVPSPVAVDKATTDVV